MTQHARTVLEAARALPRDERAELACELMRGLDAEDPNGTAARDAAWAEWADRRDRAIDAGDEPELDGEEILAKLERGECP